MNDSFNPSETPSGPFSPLSSLLRDALREGGETSPDVTLAVEQKRLINYANRVVGDVNTHPYFLDLLRTKWTRTTGTISAGSTSLTVPAGVQFTDNTIVVIEGAGAGGGDFYSTIFSSPNLTQATGTYELQDAAITAVTNAVVRSPYESRLRRYASPTEIRAIDDMVMIDGIKYYAAFDDSASMGQPMSNINLRSVYFQTLNRWLADMHGLFGQLNVSPVERDVN